MHRDIAIMGVSAWLVKSILCLVFDLIGSINGTMFNRVARLNKMVMKICVGY